MRIKEIERENSYNIYRVTLVPTFLEKLFGIKEKVRRFKDDGSTYRFGGGTVYINEDGENLGPNHSIGEAIDKWRRKF